MSDNKMDNTGEQRTSHDVRPPDKNGEDMSPEEREHRDAHSLPGTNQAGKSEQERGAGEEKLGAHLAEYQDAHGEGEDRKAGPRWARFQSREMIALLPEDECGKQGDEESVGEVGIVPPLADQARECRPIQPES